MARQPSKQSKAAEVLAKLAAAQGGTFDISSLAQFKSTVETTREAESVLRSLHKPHAYILKKCKRTQCGQPFKTNYCSMAYCSDACLAADLRAVGINWDPFRMRRWESSMYASNSGVTYRYEEPEYISTQTLLELEEWAQRFLADLARLRKNAQVQEDQQSQEKHEDPQPEIPNFELAGYFSGPVSAQGILEGIELIPEPLLDPASAMYDEVPASLDLTLQMLEDDPFFF